MTQDRQSHSGPAKPVNYHRREKSFGQLKTLHKLKEFKFLTSRNSNFDKAFTMTIKVKVTKLGIVWFLSPGTIRQLKIGEKIVQIRHAIATKNHVIEKLPNHQKSDLWCHRYQKLDTVKISKIGYRQSMRNCSKNIPAKFHLDPTRTRNDGAVGFFQSRSQNKKMIMTSDMGQIPGPTNATLNLRF